MKANEAPEKIYLYPSDIPDQEYEAEWGCQPWDESSIEYTRTDVFVDKAIEKLKNLSAGFWIDHLVTEFKKAMKEE